MQQFVTQMFQLGSEMTEKQQRAAFKEQAVETGGGEKVNATNMQMIMEQPREVMMAPLRVNERRESGQCVTETAVEPKIA